MIVSVQEMNSSGHFADISKILPHLNGRVQLVHVSQKTQDVTRDIRKLVAHVLSTQLLNFVSAYMCGMCFTITLLHTWQ